MKAFLLLVTMTVVGATNRQLQTSSWEGPYNTSVVGAGAANLPGGKVLLFSGQLETYWGRGGSTMTVLWDPSDNTMVQETVTTNSHNFFCPGTSNLADGRVMITGGRDSYKTTIYNATTGEWTAGADMNINRGYQAQTVLANGDVFVLGGSWGVSTDERGDKNGEVWSSESNSWRLLPGVPDDPFLTNDAQGVYRSDNHMWLFLAPNNNVFHAGPSQHMHWITTDGSGSVTNSTLRGNDDDAMNGNALMYDIGKILTVGGAPHYQYRQATGSKRAYIIDINGDEAKVSRTGKMNSKRTLANCVLLPSGEVVVLGGMSRAILFSDDGSADAPEIWSPKTGLWTKLKRMSVPRTYHSVALLLKDGRIMTAGGGLCNCDVDHPDLEIFTPPYLYGENGQLAERPIIESAPSVVGAGQRFTVTMDSPDDHTFALVRLSSVTHSVNNDSRRIPLSATRSGSVFELTVPPNPSVALAGAYYLFAMNEAGVPSIGEDILIQLGYSGPFAPDPAKTYYIESPTHKLRLAANGYYDLPYTTSITTIGGNVEWQFVAKGNGYWHIRRASGGLQPGLRVKNGKVDMQKAASTGRTTFYDVSEGSLPGTTFLTLPKTDDPGASRLEITGAGAVNFVSNTSTGVDVSLRIVEVV